MSIRETVLTQLAAIVEEHSVFPFPDDVTDNTKLDEFWLDSIAFAALISGLEESMGYIPENFLDRTFFPESVGELVKMYVDTSEE